MIRVIPLLPLTASEREAEGSSSRLPPDCNDTARMAGGKRMECRRSDGSPGRFRPLWSGAISNDLGLGKHEETHVWA
jgi:hypothetical protein